MLIALLPLVGIGLVWRNSWINATTCSSINGELKLLPRPMAVCEP